MADCIILQNTPQGAFLRKQLLRTLHVIFFYLPVLWCQCVVTWKGISTAAQVEFSKSNPAEIVWIDAFFGGNFSISQTFLMPHVHEMLGSSAWC